MNINEREILIVKLYREKNIWKDITGDVQWFENSGKIYKIKYKGNANIYSESMQNVKIFNNPKRVDIKEKIVYCNNEPLYGVSSIIVFDSYAKIFYNTRTKLVSRNSIKTITDLKDTKEVKELIDYLKEVAKLVSNENEHNFLLKQLDGLTVLKNSVLGKLLQGRLEKKKNKRIIIYPFETNLSQRLAIKRALEEDLSIIQGPPGTGKTETIRNIVANYVARGGCVAVVSGSNEATRNVSEKFEKTGLGYLNAFLGKTENVNDFFATPSEDVKKIEKIDLTDNESKLEAINENVETYLDYILSIAKIRQSISEYEVEKAINDAEYHIKERIVPKSLVNKNYTSTKLLALTSILETLPENKITGFFNRVRVLFRFGIIKLKEIAKNKEDAVEYLKNNYYNVKISELDKEKDIKQKFVDENNLSSLCNEQKDLSMRIFKGYLRERYEDIHKHFFTAKDYKLHFDKFTERYPIVYSTTHAIRSCSGNNFLYDCLIIDESSQVDLISAVIAFSMAKRVVLVGDVKQLPHVVKAQFIQPLNDIFSNYELKDYFDYSKNSILSCVLKKEKDVVSTLLNEHYRCDPQIIDFCNKRFYNGELVIRTEHTKGDGVTIISHGSHFERNRSNEREIDIIEKEIIKELPEVETGFIAPYNNQISLLNEWFGNTRCVIDTIHKFQGKEKDYIVLSTVANKIKFYEDEERIDFLNNPNLINVAISRAKKRLFILASEEVLRQEGSILRDLSKYYEYYCSETKILKTKVFSVFDLMYDDYSPILQNTKEKLLKISDFMSENIIATVIDEICKSGDYGSLRFKFNYPLRYVIKTDYLRDVDDIKFVSNLNTHCDFLIYNNLNKEIEMVVEVDGSQHKEEIQANRDRRKDRLLASAGIKVLRLSTTTIECKEKIINALIND